MLLAYLTECPAQTNLVLTAGLANAIEFVFVPGGDFLMGCPAIRPKPWKVADTFAPEHKVFVSAFWMGKYPVTVQQFSEYLNKSGNKPTPVNLKKFFNHIERLNNGAYAAKVAKDAYPIAGVSFKDAGAYCAWLSRTTGKKCRIPTEAEWEFVAKGGDKNRPYPWGGETKETRPNPLNQPTGAHPELATPEGIFDLDGPVYQWCEDFYDEGFYSVSPLIDPVCKNGDGRRVVRGGPMFRAYGGLFLAPTWKRFQQNESASDELGVGTGVRVVIQP